MVFLKAVRVMGDARRVVPRSLLHETAGSTATDPGRRSPPPASPPV